MKKINWKSKEIIKREELGKYYWYQGFYHYDFGKNDYYRRDFEEMQYRDLALFSLGAIENKKILDVGCGSGLYSLTFLRLGAVFVAGQDISEAAIQQVRQVCKENGFENCKFIAGDCQQLQFEDSSFDVVFSGDVFEHITYAQKEKFIEEIYRVLKPGGIFTIKTPNKSYLKMTNFMRRINAMLRLKNPFNMHIAHTRNNPNNEHHGLSTYKEMKRIFEHTMFHKPEIIYKSLDKNMFTKILSKLFKKSKYLNQQIVIKVRKPIFYGIYQ